MDFIDWLPEDMELEKQVLYLREIIDYANEAIEITLDMIKEGRE